MRRAEHARDIHSSLLRVLLHVLQIQMQKEEENTSTIIHIKPHFASIVKRQEGKMKEIREHLHKKIDEAGERELRLLLIMTSRL